MMKHFSNDSDTLAKSPASTSTRPDDIVFILTRMDSFGYRARTNTSVFLGVRRSRPIFSPS
jgi:hypothetical protein